MIHSPIKILLAAASWATLAGSQAAAPAGLPAALDKVYAETLAPYQGLTRPGVDRSTLAGKLMCGYQGWFSTTGAHAKQPWQHWTTDGKTPGEANIRFDAWPDMSEAGADERFPTELRHPDGKPAELFSSLHPATVDRHFQWMRSYGIDGVFVQRFAPGLRTPATLAHRNIVLSHCRAGANQHGRAYALMYDLSGLGAGRIQEVIDDWRQLRQRMHLTEDPAYLRHRGKPLVAVWGVGFSGKRDYSLAECATLVDALKADGCSVMLGIPYHWRTLKGDALPDPALHELLRRVDVISPWTVGRLRDDPGIARHASETLAPDMEWCRKAGVEYLPVIFPGFSWANMKRSPEAPFDAIPRRGGTFLTNQAEAARKAGSNMLYLAMFDEVDEGTAIFKLSNNPPTTGPLRFLAEPNLPSDHYLKLAGEIAAGLKKAADRRIDTP